MFFRTAVGILVGAPLRTPLTAITAAVSTLMILDQTANGKNHKGDDHQADSNIRKHYTVTFSFLGVSSLFEAGGLRNTRYRKSTMRMIATAVQTVNPPPVNSTPRL